MSFSQVRQEMERHFTLQFDDVNQALVLNLLSGMLQNDPAHRFSMVHVLAHPWVNRSAIKYACLFLFCTIVCVISAIYHFLLIVSIFVFY
jgi:hypothetical protein